MWDGILTLRVTYWQVFRYQYLSTGRDLLRRRLLADLGVIAPWSADQSIGGLEPYRDTTGQAGAMSL